MKAAVLNQYGVPCYGDFDEPSPQNGHSLVAVRAASVNAIDVALASGQHPARRRQRRGMDHRGTSDSFDDGITAATAPAGRRGARARFG
jgi:NADPH:quinone reductase-like Zn-dependent oxidoreductase